MFFKASNKMEAYMYPTTHSQTHSLTRSSIRIMLMYSIGAVHNIGQRLYVVVVQGTGAVVCPQHRTAVVCCCCLGYGSCCLSTTSDSGCSPSTCWDCPRARSANFSQNQNPGTNSQRRDGTHTGTDRQIDMQMDRQINIYKKDKYVSYTRSSKKTWNI